MVQEPVQEADGGVVLGEEPSPFLEGPVAGDGEAAAFVGSGTNRNSSRLPVLFQRREHDVPGLERALTRVR